MSVITDHEHVTKVLKFKLDENANWVIGEYGCTMCDIVSPDPFETEERESEHSTHVVYVEGCFACKAATLSVQDLHIKAISHANDRELTAYRDARKQGIQPASTKMKDIQAAVRVSDATGVAAKAR